MKSLIVLSIALLTSVSAFAVNKNANIVCRGEYQKQPVIGTFQVAEGNYVFVLQNAKQKVEALFVVVLDPSNVGKDVYVGEEYTRDGQLVEGNTFKLFIAPISSNPSLLVRYKDRKELDRTKLQCKRLVRKGPSIN